MPGEAMTSREFHRAPNREAAAALLREVGLPVDDLADVDLSGFLACGGPGGLVGLVGTERQGDVALLRSLAVAPSHRGTGLGRELVRRAEAWCAASGVTAVYLLTNTAEGFFARLGYERLPRGEAPPFIRSTREFAGICPASAAFMVRYVTAAIAADARRGDADSSESADGSA